MITKAIPQIHSLDLERAQAFYVSKLRFILKRKYNNLVILEKDGFELHLCLCQEPGMPKNSSIFFHVDDIEKLYEQCDVYGIVRPNTQLEDKTWGMREFYVIDPDNNLIRFGQFSIGGFHYYK